MDSSLNKIDNYAELLKILGDKTRLTIFAFLKSQEFCVCELTSLLEISQPAISQHLRKLKLLNLVTERKKGQWVYYSIREPKENEQLLKAIIDNLPDMINTINSKEGILNTCSIN